MARTKQQNRGRGARSVLAEDQPSFIDEHGRRGKQFSGGRKTESLPFVGVRSPDADPEGRPRRAGPRSTPSAERMSGKAGDRKRAPRR